MKKKIAITVLPVLLALPLYLIENDVITLQIKFISASIGAVLLCILAIRKAEYTLSLRPKDPTSKIELRVPAMLVQAFCCFLFFVAVIFGLCLFLFPRVFPVVLFQETLAMVFLILYAWLALCRFKGSHLERDYFMPSLKQQDREYRDA